jgi:rubrerythrin
LVTQSDLGAESKADRSVSSRRAAPPPSFNESTTHVDISPLERTLGVKSKRYFDRTLKRRPPWLIKNSGITVLKGNLSPSAQEQVPGPQQLPALKAHAIPTEALEKERITPLLASVLLTFKRIEDKLPDFSGTSFGLFRNIWGINNAYHQWSFEENQHSDAIALVLERTGSMTELELENDYYDNLTWTWEPPFPTARQMVLYAAFQEQLTSLNYHSVARRAQQEDAPTVAEIMTLIAHDEAYHGGGYRAFSRMFAELDLEGTIQDALHVARNFRMPAQHLMRDRKKNSIEIVRAGAFSKRMVSEETIYHVLTGLRFVPEEQARETANRYWQQ